MLEPVSVPFIVNLLPGNINIYEVFSRMLFQQFTLVLWIF